MAGKKVDGGTVTIKVTDGDSLKDIQRKVKKARGEFDALSKSTQAADRAGKGITKQSSNQTKNFSKMQQGISGGIVPAYATLAANVFALSAAFQFLQVSMNTKNMIEGQKAFGSITGVAYGTITDSIRKATQGQLAFKEAAESAAIGTAAGLNRDQLERLGVAATNVSIALGRDLTDSFNRLIRGVTKAEPELLDELGIVLRLDPALRAYGVSIGKAVSDLNQFEKSQAIANEVLGQAESKFGAIQEVMEPGAFALGQFTSSFNDLLDTLKNALGGLAQTVLPFFTENVAALASALALVAVPILKIMLPNFEAMSASAAKNVTATKGSLETLQDELNQTSLASQALSHGGADKLGQVGAKSSKKIATKYGITGKGTDGNLSQRQVAAYRRTWAKKKGIWKKMTKQERIDFKLSLDQMDLAHKASTGKQNLETTKSELKKKADYKKTEIFYKKTQLMMVQASRAGAAAMNMALKAAGIIGIITMIGSAVMAVVNAFKQVDEIEEKRRASMKEQASVNATINDELERMIALRTKEVNILKEGKLERKRILETTTEMNMQTAQALSSAALGAQAQKFLDAFDENTGFREKISYVPRNTGTGRASGAPPRAVKTITETFLGKQGDAQEGLAGALGGMASMMSADFFFNAAGIGEEKRMVNAKETLAAFQKQVEKGEPLSEMQIKDLLKIESQYGSLASRVKLAGEIQKTYDKNLVKMGGKGRYGQAMRNSIAEMEKAIIAQEEIANMRNAEDKLDEDKLEALKEQKKKVADFKQDIADILELDTQITDAKHEQAMAMEAAKISRGFETKMSELALKDEAKRIKMLESEKKLAEAIAAQSALGEAATKDQKADAEENVRIAKQKLELSKEELRIQKELTLQAELQARLKKFGEEIKAVDKLVASVNKLRDAQIEAVIPGFSSMSKGTKDATYRSILGRQGVIDEADAKFTRGKNALMQQHNLLMEQNNLTQAQILIAEADLLANLEILRLQKEKDQRSGIEIAYDNARGAGFKSLEGGLSTGLMSVAKGEKTGSEAAKEVALGVAEAIMQSLIQSLVSELLTKLFTEMALQTILESQGNIALAANTAAITANTAAVAAAATVGAVTGRTGGVFEAGKRVQGYSSGGVANGSTSGYPAILHGREAVIPIPSGEKVPVEVKGGMMTNSVVNVTVNSDGSSSMDEKEASAFGKGIQSAVQKEIARQQRFGGLLSGK